MTDRDDELPDVPGSAHDADRDAREARIDALLSLSSTAPASLDANIAARRAAGDRVILPVEDADDAPAARDPRRAGRTLLLTLGLAAAAALLLFMRGGEPEVTGDPRTPPVLAGTDPLPAPVVAGVDSAGRSDSVPRVDSGAPLAPRRGDIQLGFERTTPAGASFGARLERFSTAAIDSTVAAAARDSGAPIEIGYPGTSTELASLAQRIEQALVAGGVAADRVTRVPYGASVMRADVSITVGGARPPR
jgi:hypothetical protein